MSKSSKTTKYDSDIYRKSFKKRKQRSREQENDKEHLYDDEEDQIEEH